MEYIWVGQRLIDIVGLHFVMPFSRLVCCDYGIESTGVATLLGAPVYSLERASFARKVWTSQYIRECVSTFSVHSDFMQILADRSVVVAYRANTLLEHLANTASGSMVIVAPASAVVDRLDDKFFVYSELQRIGVRQPDGLICKPSETSYFELSRRFGGRFVGKLRHGGGGSGTFIVSSEREFDEMKMKSGEQEVLLTQFVEGPSFNIHAAIINGNIQVSPPSFQLVGLHDCSRGPSEYCGNDFSIMTEIDDGIAEVLASTMHEIGRWMMGLGFRGIFGVDFVGTEDTLAPIDINPRFQGSTSLLTQSQILANQFPTSFHHIAEFTEMPATWLAKGPPVPLRGSQIILHSLSPNRISVRRPLWPGVYRFNGSGQIAFERPGVSLLDIESPDEFVVTCAVPRQNTVIHPGAPMLKLIFSGSVVDVRSLSLKEQFSALVQWVYSMIGSTDGGGS